MITRDHYEGPISFTCDHASCSEHHSTGECDWSSAIADLKNAGWRNILDKSTNEWGHYCPTHRGGAGIVPFAKEPIIEPAAADTAVFAEAPAANEPLTLEAPLAPPVPSIQLGPQQLEAEAKIMHWLLNTEDPFFVLAGYAGTGKTTLSKKLAQNLGNRVTFGAFTGKAVNILREKGCPNVDTIHTLLYKPAAHDKTKLVTLEMELKEAQSMGNPFQIDVLTRQIDEMKKEMRKPKFELNMESIGGDVLFVDEYSMLPNEILGDLSRKYRKILFMGDPFQLPPVKGNCNLKPDFFLTEIHRQALESGIVRLSIDIRENNSFSYGDYGDLLYIPSQQAHQGMYIEADQVICGRNATRSAINQFIRAHYGFNNSPWPAKGEKLICLKNNKKAGLFNGAICYATADAIKAQPHHTSFMLKVDMQLQPGYETISVWDGDVLGKGDQYDWNDWNMKSLNRFDFAHAITCHKSQGSEFNNCLVYHEPIGADDEMKRRWTYTAITRGKKFVTLVQP